MIKNSLVGRWLIVSEGDYYKTGQVILSLGANHHLCKWRPCSCGPETAELLRIDNLCTDEKEDRFVHFFDTEDKLNEWQAWLNTPSDDKKPRVVALKPKP